MTLTATYDAHEDSWNKLTEAEREQLGSWLQDHGIGLSDTIRIELHDTGQPIIRVFAYWLNEHGGREVDETGESARRAQPYDVPQQSAPPVQPWSRTP